MLESTEEKIHRRLHSIRRQFAIDAFRRELSKRTTNILKNRSVGRPVRNIYGNSIRPFSNVQQPKHEEFDGTAAENGKTAREETAKEEHPRAQKSQGKASRCQQPVHKDRRHGGKFKPFC